MSPEDRAANLVADILCAYCADPRLDRHRAIAAEIRAAVEEEREANAKIAEDYCWREDYYDDGDQIATLIRARSRP